jgi:hypothetical protein
MGGQQRSAPFWFDPDQHGEIEMVPTKEHQGRGMMTGITLNSEQMPSLG